MKTHRLTQACIVATLAFASPLTAAAGEVIFRATPHADSTTFDPAGAFEFAPAANRLLNELVVSEASLFKGSTKGSKPSVTGAEYRICGAPGCSDLGATGWRTSGGTIVDGQRIQLRVAAPSIENRSVEATASIGGTTRKFTVSTRTAAPTVESLTNLTDQTELSNVVSNQATVRGWSAATASVDGGASLEVCRPNAACSVAAGSSVVSDGDQIRIRATAPAAGTSRSVALTIGGRVAANWTVSSRSAQVYANVQAKCVTWDGAAKASRCLDAQLNIENNGWTWPDPYAGSLQEVWCQAMSGNKSSKSTYSAPEWSPYPLRSKYHQSGGSDSIFVGNVAGYGSVWRFHYPAGSNTTAAIECSIWK